MARKRALTSRLNVCYNDIWAFVPCNMPVYGYCRQFSNAALMSIRNGLSMLRFIKSKKQLDSLGVGAKEDMLSLA